MLFQQITLLGLCLLAGCTKLVMQSPPQEWHVPAAKEKVQSQADSADVVVAQQGQEQCRAKIGQAVHFPFGYTVVPALMIFQLKVTVNGKPIESPEVFSPSTAPGHGELIYVFRPTQAGEYRVEVTPVYESGNGTGICCVVKVW